MAAPTKPGIDWPSVKARVIAGESPSEIARSYNGLITRQAIERRSKREGWAARALATIRRRAAVIDQRGNRTPDNREKILKLISEGISVYKAARACGFSEPTLRDWLASDPEFDADFENARIDWERERIGSIARAESRGDWKASAYRLEKHEFTAGQYAPKEHTGASINVTLNIPDPGVKPVVTIDGESQ